MSHFPKGEVRDGLRAKLCDRVWSALGAGQGADDRLGAVGIPFGVAAHPGDFLAVFVQDQRDRQAKDGHVAGEFLFRVEVKRQVVDADRRRRIARMPGTGIAARGDGDDFEGVAAEFGLQVPTASAFPCGRARTMWPRSSPERICLPLKSARVKVPPSGSVKGISRDIRGSEKASFFIVPSRRASSAAVSARAGFAHRARPV